MRVKLTFIERDFRGNDLTTREEFLEGESAKSLTRNHVAKLIARHHPELRSVVRVWLLDASETSHKWFIGAEKLEPNKWVYVYADPVPEPTIMVPFRYVEFYDVPRLIALRYKGKLLLLQSAFSETLDEYPNAYSVYELPESSEPLLAAGSWRSLEHMTLTSMGEIPVSAVKFDSTKRKTLDPSILDPLLDRQSRG